MKKAFCSICFSLFIICPGLLPVGEAGADNHALLIGIGHYPYLQNTDRLEGPPNDVRALADMLAASWNTPRENMTVLIDERASRADIFKALNNLEPGTRPGDFILIYFSGHGTSYYDRALRSQLLDPYTGAILAYDFRPGQNVKDALEQLIVGQRDLRPILASLEKDRRVLVIIDSCFSGMTVRGERRATMTKPKYKNVSLKLDDPGASSGDSSESYFQDPAPYPYQNVAYIAASSRMERAHDITRAHIECGLDTLDGLPHGALTDALLRGLAGGADTNRDRTISLNELYQYARKKVTQRFSLQTPQMLYNRENGNILNKSLFPIKGSVSVIPKPNPAAGRHLRVKVQGLDPALENQIQKIEHLEIVGQDEEITVATLEDRFSIFLPNGYELISLPFDQTDRLLLRLAKQVQVKKLIGLEYDRQDFNIFLKLVANPGVMVQGTRVGFKIQAEKDCHILLLDIDSAGNVNVIYPNLDQRNGRLTADEELVLPEIGTVVPEFGTDHIKVFAFRQKPDGMEKFLDQSFSPLDSLFPELLAMIEKAGKEAAQTTISFKTAARQDLGVTGD